MKNQAISGNNRPGSGALGCGKRSCIRYSVWQYVLDMGMLEKGLFKPSISVLCELVVAVVGLTAMAYAGHLKDEQPKTAA